MLEIVAPLYRPQDLIELLQTAEEMNILDDKSICWTPYCLWMNSILPAAKTLEWPHNAQPPSDTTLVPSREMPWYVATYTRLCKSEKYYEELLSQPQVENWLDLLTSLKKVQDLEKRLEASYLLPTENAVQQDVQKPSTSTQSMIATNPTGNAVAPYSNISNLFSSLKAKYSEPNIPSETSLTSSYISVKMDGKLQAFSLREPEAEYLLHLRCWKLKDVKDIPQKDRYQHTYASVTLNMGEDSSVHQHITHLVNAAATELMSKGANYWERK
jgi:hypothetical protein